MAGHANVIDVYEIRIKGKFHFNFELKDEQVEVVESILRGNHTVGVFPLVLVKVCVFYHH